MSEVTGTTAGKSGAWRIKAKLGWLLLLVLGWPSILPAQPATPALNFFTNTADRLIRYTTTQWYAHDPVDYPALRRRSHLIQRFNLSTL